LGGGETAKFDPGQRPGYPPSRGAPGLASAPANEQLIALPLVGLKKRGGDCTEFLTLIPRPGFPKLTGMIVRKSGVGLGIGINIRLATLIARG